MEGRKYPNFILAGIMKSGTTFLDTRLRNHPQIKMPERSMNYSFFDNDEIYNKDKRFYQNLFKDYDFDKYIVGQTSADCAFNKNSIKRIKDLIPDCKLIFIIRHPIDRINSLYWHQVSMGREFYSIEKALKKEIYRTKKNYYSYKHYSYLARSQYANQFKEIFKHFREKDILIIPFEDVVKDQLKFLNIIFKFLKVEKIDDINKIITGFEKNNKARLPSYIFVAKIAFLIQKIGFLRISRIFLNRFRVETKTPRISNNLKAKLEIILKDDIAFYNSIINKY